VSQGLETSIPLDAGLAAYHGGDWQRAAGLLDQAEEVFAWDMRLSALSDARRRMGDRAGTADALFELLENTSGDDLEPMLAEALELADENPASFRRQIFSFALESRARDPELHLGYSESLLRELEREPPETGERELLQQARRAARLARLLTDDEAAALRADELLARAERVEAGLGESRGDAGSDDLGPELRPAG